MSENEIETIYVDGMRMTVSVFGVSITFGISEPHPSSGSPPKPEDRVNLRMSLEHAKTTAMILRKQLKQYEEQTSTSIELPANVYTGLGIAREDWGS